MKKKLTETATEELIRKGEMLECTTAIAIIVNMVRTIDLRVLDDLIAEQTMYHSVEAIIDPTRYRAEAKGMDASWAVMRSVRELRKVIDEVRNKEAEQ